MQVTPVNRKFGKHAPGDVFELRDKTAKVLIKIGKLAHAGYLTRDMRAEHPQAPTVIIEVRQTAVADPVVEDASEEAPYGYKADGTPRKRPGRPASET
jgi:hypothetical protein